MHEEYMRQALDLAREAAACGEVPVGCVIVKDGRVIGRGRNRREERQAAWSHAEMEAMAQANRALGTWRLDGCTLYVTLEPCPMCAGAILNARVSRVYFGARDREMGACGGVMNLFMEDSPPPWWAACWRRNAPGSCGIFSGACARSKISLIFPLTKPGKVAILCHIECKCSDGDQ